MGAADRRGITRRGLLKTTAAGGALAGLSSVAGASTGTEAVKKTMLLDRITGGINEDMWAEYDLKHGYTGFLNWQLAPATVPDDALPFDIFEDNQDFANLWWDMGVNPPVERANIAWSLGQGNATLPGGTQTLFERYNPGAWALMYITTVQEHALLGHRSRRQLYWAMAEFWQNVHNTWVLPIPQRPYWQDFFRDNIAKNSLGYYGDLVKASAKGMSMLLFLNQYSSTASNPIENYARELLELHTVGTKPGDYYHPDFHEYRTYAEEDIVPVAEVFTGWTFDLTNTPQKYARFRFDVNNHKSGNKTIPFLEHEIESVGQAQGEELIDILAGRPPSDGQAGIRPHVLTAFHMATRLMEWFICEDALSPQFRNHTYRVAAAFWASFGHIESAVRALFDEAYFDEIRPGPHMKIRNPLQLTTGLFRAVQPDIDYDSLAAPNITWANRLEKMGRLCANHPAPDGYSNANAEWSASMMARFEFVYDVVYSHNGIGFTIEQSRLDEIFPASVSRYGYGQRLNDLFMGGCLPGSAIAEIHSYLDGLNQPGGMHQGYDLRLETLVMFFSMPEYQFKF